MEAASEEKQHHQSCVCVCAHVFVCMCVFVCVHACVFVCEREKERAGWRQAVKTSNTII